MLLAPTEYVRPGSLEEAIDELGARPGARVLAGGQSLINVLKHRAASVELLVDVSRLEELRFIDVDADGSARIGAATTYGELERSAELRGSHAIVSRVAAGTVDRQVRARGTIGGNACFADPASNYPPLLIALGAQMEIAGPDGTRSVAAEDFFLGLWRTVVGPGEVLTAIALPPLGGASVGYRSLQIAADSWALARAAVWIAPGDPIQAARVVLGCVAGRPVRASAAEERLIGGPRSAQAAADAGALAAEGLDPPSDVHASGGYRRAMAAVMAARALSDALGFAEEVASNGR
ncbi:MAG TPA: xanthine dehydrogenase family protein subunit M [Solirubrobacteraceae bacterium]|jgi:carbon-monoxide dehydrogenase medium subunit|nr:xanthine dehydrogenase family protein subunit M [Solirubrobacteraceae bacterium]